MVSSSSPNHATQIRLDDCWQQIDLERFASPTQESLLLEPSCFGDFPNCLFSDLDGWDFPELSSCSWNDERSTVSGGSNDSDVILAQRELPSFECPSWNPLQSSYSSHSNIDNPDRCHNACTEPGCSKRFSDAHSLQAHARQSGHKPYLCAEPQCRRRYQRLDTLTRHKLTHRDTSAHACQICASRRQRKTFTRKDHLHQHLRVCHSKEQAHQGTSTPSVSEEPGYQSQAVKEIVHALKTIYGEDNDALRVLEQQWDLHQGSTTEQLAVSLAQLARNEPQVLAKCSNAPLSAKRKALG